MQNQAQPWLSLYRGVPPEIKPSCETALDMFRMTLARNGGAPLVHYFERSISFAECDAMSDALAVGLQERGIEVGDRGPEHDHDFAARVPRPRQAVAPDARRR